MVENRSNLQSSFNLLIVMGTLLGLVLAVIGALLLSHVIFLTWQLYDNPDSIMSFAQSLKLAKSGVVEMDLNGLDPLRLIAWPLVILVLLLQGKIGMWAIEAGARLLGAARNK
ncbi:MAG: hypothetical protein H6964_09490 [Chromatiaceae bacterium]|nr:hypothetical protein [Gammaproteobacteria bacterium]MCP5428007.1 hypothetical protein [Chromatiaceae bacterium]MCB1861149.1 hypothetical protein [Gammaproteobacteria bacterium]MCB1873862.1 hypothetical protein [Gammaproteobacteria bacterium]MCB1905435.1 hypothetical protein [Gammaproteobacteria bacterium]